MGGLELAPSSSSSSSSARLKP